MIETPTNELVKYGSKHQRRPWALYLPADQICEPCTERCGRLSKVSRASWRYKGRLLRRVGEGRLSRYRYKSLIKAQPSSHSLYLHKVMALHVRQNNHLQPLLLPTSDQVSYILLIHTMQCLGFRLKTITNTKIKPFSIYALWKCYYHDCKGEWTRSTETEKGFQPNEHKPDKTKTG